MPAPDFPRVAAAAESLAALLKAPPPHGDGAWAQAWEQVGLAVSGAESCDEADAAEALQDELRAAERRAAPGPPPPTAAEERMQARAGGGRWVHRLPGLED